MPEALKIALISSIVGGVFALVAVVLKYGLGRLDARRKKKEEHKAFRLDLIERGILKDPKVEVFRLPKREEDKPPE